LRLFRADLRAFLIWVDKIYIPRGENAAEAKKPQAAFFIWWIG